MSAQSTEFNFTKAAIEALKPPAPGARLVVKDTKEPGLQLRVRPNGVKTFSVRKRVKNGPDERITLGKFGDISLEQARAQAAGYKADFARGKSVAKRQREQRGEQTFSELFEVYMTRHGNSKGKTSPDIRRRYELHVQKAIGSKKLSAIDEGHCRTVQQNHDGWSPQWRESRPDPYPGCLQSSDRVGALGCQPR